MHLGTHVRLRYVVEVSRGEVLQEALGEVLLHHVRIALAKVPLLYQGVSVRAETPRMTEMRIRLSTGKDNLSSSSPSLRRAGWYFWIFSTLER